MSSHTVAPSEPGNQTADGQCPRCQGPLVVEPRAARWCAACEWNLDAYDHLHADVRWRWRLAGRVDHWIAFRLNARAFARVGTRPPARRAGLLARLVLTAVALPVLALAPACLALAAYLVAIGTPSGPVLAFFLVLLALVIRPRVPRLSRDAWVVTRSSTPKLFGLLDRVAAASSAHVPQTVILYPTANAFVAMLGLRRRLLAIGLPLWAGLAPQQRVALLAHEMGHLVNHDIRRGRIVGVARRTLFELLGFLFDLARRTAWLATPILLLPAAALGLANALLLLIGQRDGQRAEYLADEIAATVAGTDAVAGLLDATLMLDDVRQSIATTYTDGGDPAAWRTAAERVESALHDRLPLLRQRSVREGASLLASHPPTGLRAGRLHRRPYQTPAVMLTAEEAAQVDIELSEWYRRLRTRLADSAGR
jgi:Zn-dependent protease with chaperone function